MKVSEINSPIVSTLFVVRNDQAHIKKSFLSILDQTYNNLEVVIIDDASTDNTVNMIDEMISRYIGSKKIIFIKNEIQIGLTKNLNKAIDIGTGEYFIRQDGDDWSHPKRVETQVKTMLSENIDVVGTNHYLTDYYGIFKIRIKREPTNFIFTDFLKPRSNFFAHGTIMIKSKVLRKEHYNIKCLFCQDYELYCWLSFNNYKIKRIENILYYHRIPMKYNEEKKQMKIQIRQALLKYYKGKFNARFFADIKTLPNLNAFDNRNNFFSHYKSITKLIIDKKLLKK